MPSIGLHAERPKANPIDLVEKLVVDHEWPFDRQGSEELTVGLGGKFCDFQLWFSWREEAHALHFSCAFDMKAPDARRRELQALIVHANEKLPVGHFDLWREEGMVLFRHALLLRGLRGASPEQIEDLVEIALSECERFYPAFQFLVWGGKSPEEAIAAAMIETVGEA